MYRKLTKSLLIVLLLIGARSIGLAQTVFTPGILREDFFSGISGGVDGLIGDPRYPSSPDTNLWWNSFGPHQAGNNQGDNYGQIISGYVIPPATGNYKFYLRSDDPSRLFISSDDKAANLGGDPIAEQTGCCNAFTDAEGTLSSVPIALTAGKKYYIQALHVEGGGDDYVQVAWRTPNDADLNDANGLKPIPAAYIGADAPSAGASVSITSQPSNVSLPENAQATFTVAYTAAFNGRFLTSAQTQDADAATDASIVWFKNGVPIPGQSKASYTTPLLKAGDNGAKYKAQVSVPGAVAVSSEATLTVSTDSTPPTVVSVNGTASLTTGVIKFSEPVTSATATDKANYVFDGGLTVSSVELSDPSTVRLTTSKQEAGKTYNLTINNIKDTATPANTIAANTKLTLQAFVLSAGGVLHQKFENVTQNNIAGLTGDPRFPNKPDLTTIEPAFEYPPNGGNEAGSNYGNILSGWLTPTKSGDYVFFCSGDDPIEVWLSTDDNPVNKHLICKEPQWNNARQWTVTDRRDPDNPENRSDRFVDTQWPTGATITLTAGKSYYIEALHTEGGGGDSVGVAWKLAADPDPANGDPPISAALVSTYLDPTGAKVDITQQPVATTVFANDTATLSVAANGSSLYGTNVTYQWFKNGVAIDKANSATYTIPVTASGDNGAKYKVTVSIPPISKTSDEVTLTVNSDTKLPTIVTPIIGQSSDTFTAVQLKFSEPVTSASVVAGNFALSGGATVSGAKLVDQWTVELTTSKLAEDTDYTVTVNNVADNAGNKVAANSTASFHSWKLIAKRAKATFYTGIAGTAVGDLTGDVSFPATPANTRYFTGLEAGSANGNAGWNDTFGDNYGAVMNAWIIPTETGAYDFFIRSDDASQLFVSTNETFPDPKTSTPVAEETGCCNAFLEPGASQTTAAPINLTAGKKYGVSVVWKEGGGGDGVAVGWRKGGTTTPAAGALPSLSDVVWYYGPVASTTPGGDSSISIARGANGISLTFKGPVQQSDKVNGPWTDLSGASPITVTPAGTAKFYRNKP